MGLKGFRLNVAYLLACYLFSTFIGCDTFGAAPPLEKPVPPPTFSSFSKSPERIKPGGTCTISFSVISPVSSKTYNWFIITANEAGGSVDKTSGSGVNGVVYTVHFTAKNPAFAEVAVTAWYPVDSGNGRRSATKCACILVSDDPKIGPCRVCSVLNGE